MALSTVTRRRFVQGAALGAASLTACGAAAAEASASEAPAGTPAAGSPVDYEVYHTDLLVLGTGNAGIWATQRALQSGKKILMIDKGPFRHSGASNMNWDAWMLWWDYAGYRNAGWSLINGNTSAKAYEYLGGTEFNPWVQSINHGQTLVWRDEQGMPQPESPATPWAVCSAFFRREADDLFESGRVDVMDETMITGFLVNNGRCLGAVGLHLPTGTMRVIRADATVMATGGSPQIHGWLSVGYRGINSTDNTGDAAMGAFRQGISIGEAEFAQYDFNSIIFMDVAHTFGCGIGADAGELELLYDSDHNRIFSDEEIAAGNIGGNPGMSKRIAQKVFEEGKGSEHGGCYVTYDEKSFETVRYPIMRNIQFYRNHGYEPIGQYTEVAAEMFEHGGEPVVDESMMTEWAGLFDVRGASAIGENGGAHMMHNRLYGAYTGHCAVEYIDAAEPVDEGAIDWSGVEAEMARLHEIRTRKVEDGLRPWEIRRKIQEAGYHGFTIYRSTQMMEEALAELARIREEDMPRMMPADDSTTYNQEWKAAIENYNLLDCAEVSIKASLMREESRGAYVRPEFPDRDDENWNCLIAWHMEDGQMVAEKRPYPPLEA